LDHTRRETTPDFGDIDKDDAEETLDKARGKSVSGQVYSETPEKNQTTYASGQSSTGNSSTSGLPIADAMVITAVPDESSVAIKDSAPLGSSTNTSDCCEPEVTETQVVTVAPSNLRCAVSRTTTNAMKLCQFASIACVMLSFTTIVLETKNMRDTLRNLRAGSPCEKALRLREIKKKIESLPDTQEVAAGCESYLKSKAN
jgi:hypothetical protein